MLCVSQHDASRSQRAKGQNERERKREDLPGKIKLNFFVSLGWLAGWLAVCIEKQGFLDGKNKSEVDRLDEF